MRYDTCACLWGNSINGSRIGWGEKPIDERNTRIGFDIIWKNLSAIVFQFSGTTQRGIEEQSKAISKNQL